MLAPEPLNDVVQNILDEPIAESVKRRLLKPLLPGKHRPSAKPRSNIQRKQKAIPKDTPSKTFQTNQDYQKKILQLFEQEKTDGLVFRRTPLVIANYMLGWQMHVPQGLPIGTDPKAFLENVCPQIRQKLTAHQWCQVPACPYDAASER